MNKISIAFLAATMIAGCSGGNPPKPAACTITVSSTASVDQNAAFNLTTFARRPATANFRHDLASEFNSTFRLVRNSNTKCQMLKQLAACYSNESEPKRRVIELTEKTKVCE